MKVCWKSVEITVSRDDAVSPTLRTRNNVLNSAGCLNSLQTVTAKTVQTRKLLWISESVVTYGTAYVSVNYVEKGLDVHDKCGKRSIFTLNTP